MNNQGYICCFYGNSTISSQVDVTGLITISNWDKSLERQQEQQLFCRMNCFREKIDKQVPLYIADI